MTGLLWRYGPTLALLVALPLAGWLIYRGIWQAGYAAAVTEHDAQRARAAIETWERMNDADTGNSDPADDAGWLSRRGQGAR